MHFEHLGYFLNKLFRISYTRMKLCTVNKIVKWNVGQIIKINFEKLITDKHFCET